MKRLVLLLVLGILIFSSVSIAQEEITHEEIVKSLGFWDKIKYNIMGRNRFLTVAGQERECSPYPDVGPNIESPGARRTITCNGRESLINAYTISDKWYFMGEWNSPVTLGFSPKWAWECYYCVPLEGVCGAGETACYTQTSYKECTNIGRWSSPKSCLYDQICAGGRCQSFACVEEWTCTPWGSCDSGLKRRTCTDNNKCGTIQFRQSTTERCEVVTNPPPRDPGGTTDPRTGEPQLGNVNIEASNVKVSAEGREITMSVDLKNTGESMIDNMLLEMQVRPKGMSPLGLIGVQEVCDPAHPENVHQQFILEKGESVTVRLSTIVKDGDYDVYGITVNKCHSIAPVGNVDYAPFGRGELLATVKINSGGRSAVVRTWGEGSSLSSIIDAVGSMIYLIMVLVLVVIGLIIYKVVKRKK